MVALLGDEEAAIEMGKCLQTWNRYCAHLKYLSLVVYNFTLGWLHDIMDKKDIARMSCFENGEEFNAKRWFYYNILSMFNVLESFYHTGEHGLATTREHWESEFVIWRSIAQDEEEGTIAPLLEIPFHVQPTWDFIVTGYHPASPIPPMPMLPPVTVSEAAQQSIEASGADFDDFEEEEGFFMAWSSQSDGPAVEEVDMVDE
jgi:hypothetical protein